MPTLSPCETILYSLKRLVLIVVTDHNFEEIYYQFHGTGCVNFQVYIGEEAKHKLMETLTADVEFLMKLHLMDYSLLLGKSYINLK